MKPIRVVAAVIRDGEKSLPPCAATVTLGDCGSFPAEKSSLAKHRSKALKREIREELASEIAVGELIDTVEFDYPTFHLSMDCFWCQLIRGNLELLEAAEARWTDKGNAEKRGMAAG